jgi:hypothetical protein
LLPNIFLDDDGGYTIDVDGPSFRSRRFASAVAVQELARSRGARQ